jgi:acyl carrier protein
MSDTFEQIKAIELLGVDESKVTMEARFREDLEADSLDLVELIMAFEDKFGGQISDEDAQKIVTVGDAVKYVEEHM